MPDFFVKEKPAATGPVNVEIFSINRLRRQQGFKLGVHEVGKFSQRYFLSIPFELVDQFMQTYNCGNYQNFVGRKAQAYLDQQQVVGISMDAFFANYNKKTHLEVKLEAFDVEKEFVELDAQLLDVKGSVRESDNYKLLQLVWSL
ncbi:MAG TPA: hypothetical protein VK158_05875, partial [Acidobacteriota bacterium]|nr:hypothetical protein [Acidobacteriota bacterium]